MSRYEIQHEDKVLAFGHDDSCGEYLQIWQRPVDLKERSMQDRFGPDFGEMLVNEDRYTGFTRDLMLELIEERGFVLGELGVGLTGEPEDRLYMIKNWEG